MGGKSYYCDYCECFMKNDINVRKDHNFGSAHNIAKANYLQRYKVPRQILMEEKIKNPCKRISNNLECSFGFFCRFSHYSPEELAYVKFIADKNQCKKEITKSAPTTRRQNTFHDNKLLGQPTPPSLHSIDFDKLSDSCFNSQWG